MYLLYLLKSVVSCILTVLELAMFLRVIISWVPTLGGGKLSALVYTLTEPIVIPVRMLLERFELVRNSPIDISFFVAFLLLSLVESLLV